MLARLRHAAPALLLFLAAFLLRAWGANWSLPYVDHPDEPAVMNVMLHIVQGDLNPRHFFYPSLLIYTQSLLLALHLHWGALVGLYPAGFVLPRTTDFYTTIPQAYIWARVLTALLGAGAALLLVSWGSRLLDKRALWVAGGLLALSPWSIEHSHFLAVDIPSAGMALLALLALLRVLEKGNWGDYLLGALLVGLATGTKYQNAILVASFGIAHVLRWKGQSLRQAPRLLAAGGLTALVFLATTPYMLLDTPGFMKDITTLFRSYDAAHGDAQGPWPVGSYLRFLWNDGLRPVPALLTLVGIVIFIRRSPRQAAVLLSFPAIMLPLLLRQERHFYRNLLPIQPVLLICAGYGALFCWELVTHLQTTIEPEGQPPPSSTRAFWPAGLLIGILLVLTLPPALQQTALFARPDSRVLAQEWAREHYPGVRIASELEHPLQWNGQTQATYIEALPPQSLDWYRERGFGLLLANSTSRRRWDLTEDYKPLLQAGGVVATFGGQEGELRGPRIDLITTGIEPGSKPPLTGNASFGPIHLLGLSGAPLQRTLKPGETLELTAFWQLQGEALPNPLMIFVHLRNAQGQTVVQRDAPPWQGLFPPQSWRPNAWASEDLSLALPQNLPIGEYTVVIGWYDAATGKRLPTSANGAPLLNDEAPVATVQVEH